MFFSHSHDDSIEVYAMQSDSYDSSAYVTLVMLGDCYVTSALVLGRSIEYSGSRVSRRYCMVTHDVSIEARRLLSKFWTVVNVDYVSRENLPALMSNRMNAIYGSWIKHAFTKLSFIKIARDFGIRNCLYLDADTVVLRNIDHMFAEFQRIAAASATRIHIATSFYPFFSTLGLSHYHEGPLLREVRRFEQNRRNDDWIRPVNIKQLRDTWNQAIVSRKKNSVERERYFLCNASMVLVHSADDDGFADLYRSFETVFNDRANPLFQPKVSYFPNGWDEQIIAQTVLSMSSGIVRLYHLRSFCNMNAGFWNQSDKCQLYTMTWWGTVKPWEDLEPVPKYTDVYLFRYFYQLVERDFLADPALRSVYERFAKIDSSNSQRLVRSKTWVIDDDDDDDSANRGSV